MWTSGENTSQAPVSSPVAGGDSRIRAVGTLVRCLADESWMTVHHPRSAVLLASLPALTSRLLKFHRVPLVLSYLADSA